MSHDCRICRAEKPLAYPFNRWPEDLSNPVETIWSDDYLVILERLLWIAVMEYQHKINPELVTAKDVHLSRVVVYEVNQRSIQSRERKTKHDLKARLDEFVNLSGHSRIHLGMTSADVVENTYLIRQLWTVRALGLEDACQFWLSSAKFRGVRGPVGSDVDQLELLGSAEAVDGLQSHLAKRFGWPEGQVATAPGQCAPRSQDLALAVDLQIHLNEQFKLDRPNYRPDYRSVVSGLVAMFADQQPWLEGDVSSSVVRRYAWPLLFQLVSGEL